MAANPLFEGSEWLILDDGTESTKVGYYPSDGQGGVTNVAGSSVCADCDEVVLDGFVIEDAGGNADNERWGVLIGYETIPTIVGAVYTNATRNVASAGAFLNFTPHNDSQLFLVAASVLTSFGPHAIESKTDASNIVLASALGSDDLLTGVVDPIFWSAWDGGNLEQRGRVVPLGIRLTGPRANFYASLIWLDGDTNEAAASNTVRLSVFYRRVKEAAS